MGGLLFSETPSLKAKIKRGGKRFLNGFVCIRYAVGSTAGA